MTQSGKNPKRRSPRPKRQGWSRNANVFSPASIAIIIFAKAPVAGEVKTRLCPPLTPDEAASLHGSLVLDVVERCQPIKEYDRILAGSPTSQHPFFRALEARFKVPVWDQVGDDLGTRMAAAFKRALGSPYRAALVIGTDIPGLTGTFLKMAGKNLEQYDVVLGPTVDGGYYLIGLRTQIPELFENIPWSTDRVFAFTEEKVAKMGLRLKVLPMLRDLDTVEDLHVFIQESKERNNQMFSSRTKGVLQELAKRIPL